MNDCTYTKRIDLPAMAKGYVIILVIATFIYYNNGINYYVYKGI